MEIVELKYFLAAAEMENIHRASEKIYISPSSISKAISRLEDELGVSLFERQGRNIRLTSYGLLLRERASEILKLEESARMEIGNHEGKIQVIISGHEVLMSNFGFKLGQKIRMFYPEAHLSFIEKFDLETLKSIKNGESHIGLVTCEVPYGLYRKKIGSSVFQTVVGKNHKLYKKAKEGIEVSIDEVLKFPFVSPNKAILGKTAPRQSLDGWRDDKFPRKIAWSTSSLSTLAQIVDQGEALAYLPDYLVQKKNWSVLNVMDCPYSCEQKVYLVAKNIEHLSWLRRVLQSKEKLFC